MATEVPPPPDGGQDTKPAEATPTLPKQAGPPATGPSTAQFVTVQESAEFGELRRTYRSFAFPLTVAFILWYLLYVLLSNYAGGFMGTKVFGNINVALVFGLAQFLTTFLIAWFYARHAARKLDPKADAIKSRMEADV
ncbi:MULTISPECIES: DUF485 domain-containing protein [unclassified Streptomyces]|uniref:DUF485 domain-containing protein n=1 Tax=unclassified Streptomyces TaxID=2593676 RepID=UPI00099B448D|nr:DUF485 domain-containing protein [Streptomyces sp. NBC_00370]